MVLSVGWHLAAWRWTTAEFTNWRQSWLVVHVSLHCSVICSEMFVYDLFVPSGR